MASPKLRLSLKALGNCWLLASLLAALVNLPAGAQQNLPPRGAEIEGVVRDAAGKPVAGASVVLREEGLSGSTETKTNTDGAFAFLKIPAGTFTVKVMKSGFRDATEDSIKLGALAEKKHCDFILRALGESAPVSSDAALSAAITLDDRPSFTVAGVTDSTGSGGHGSETRMRTGDALAKETLKLQPGDSRDAPTAPAKVRGTVEGTSTSEAALRAALLHNPHSFELNHRLGEIYLHSERCREAISSLEASYSVNPGDHENAFDLALAYRACGEFVRAREHVVRVLAQQRNLDKAEEANLRRLLGDVDEKLENPLGAVREYERAVGLDASEQNYFAWGTELLLHRAAAPAFEVFGRGVRLHPDSARMLAGLGAALYASGSAEEAAQRLCEASDLEPANAAPYLFLGEMQEASSTPLPCAEQRLARFVRDQPENALANYYYGVALWRRERGAENSDSFQRAQALFENASAIDPKLDTAYVQLGNLLLERGATQEALNAYQKAVAANSVGSEAHYRLGLTYRRMGEETKARGEFEQYKQLEQAEAATVERQRRELRQFLFVLKDQVLKDQPK